MHLFFLLKSCFLTYSFYWLQWFLFVWHLKKKGSPMPDTAIGVWSVNAFMCFRTHPYEVRYGSLPLHIFMVPVSSQKVQKNSLVPLFMRQGGPQSHTGGPQSHTGGPQRRTGGPQSRNGGKNKSRLFWGLNPDHCHAR